MCVRAPIRSSAPYTRSPGHSLASSSLPRAWSLHGERRQRAPLGTAGHYWAWSWPWPWARPPPAPCTEAKDTYQWWWVVRTARSTTSSLLTISSSWKGPGAAGGEGRRWRAPDTTHPTHPTPTPHTPHPTPRSRSRSTQHPAQHRIGPTPTPLCKPGAQGEERHPKKPRTARGGWQGFKARLNMQHPSHRAGQGGVKGQLPGGRGLFWGRAFWGRAFWGRGWHSSSRRWARCAPPPLLLHCSRLEPPRGEPKFSAPQHPPPPGLPSWRRKETCEQAANA